MGRFKYFVGAHAEAHIWCQVAINLLAGSENWAMVAWPRGIPCQYIGDAGTQKKKAVKLTVAIEGIWKSLLRLQHWISMFCKGTTQECCLYKLSVALSSCGFDDGEAEQRMKEAQAIAWTCLGLKKDAAFVNEERTFDGLVYI
ncbi:hypothetical protein MY5147_003454 [Beauveria neobassiana]